MNTPTRWPVFSFVFCLLTFFTATQASAATAVLKTDTVATVGGYKGDNDTVAPITVTDRSVPFKKALRVTRTETSDITYAAALIWTSVTPVQKGDLLVATFYLRNRNSANGPLNLDLTYQLSGQPYTVALSAAAPVDTSSWKKYAVPVRANRNYPAGKSSFQIRYSLIKQGFDVGGVAIVNYGKVADPIPAAITKTFAYYYPDRGNANAAWRKAANARIAKFRKGEMSLRVVDAGGNPVSGASVKIIQTKSAFAWGTATSAISLTCKVDAGDSNRPCPTLDQINDRPVTNADYRRLRKELLANFNTGSFYNDLKWTDWVADQQIALDGIAWMKRNKLKLHRGHNLIWPSFEPDYLMPRQLINPATPAAEAERVIAEHFQQQLTTLKGQIPEWDVVNEPYTNYDVQGRVAATGVTAKDGILTPAAVATWFKDARRFDPKALLFLNDYGILENLNPIQQGYDLALLKYIQSLGAPVDGIGFQGHFGTSGPMFKEMQRVIDEFSPLVKAMSMTEFDFTTLDPKLQRDVMDDVMTFIFSQPKFNTFQMWGFWDGDHWLGSGPIYDRDWRLKPSGAVWQKLTRETWMTKTTGTTSTSGTLSRQAYYGTYKISVTKGSKTCTTSQSFTKPGAITVTSAC